MSDSTNTTLATAAAASVALAASTGALAQTVPKLGPKSTGSPGPGEYNGGTVDYSTTGVQGPINEDTFGCDVFRVERIATPDWTTANVYFERKVFMDGELRMPDGRVLTYWGFEDPLKAKGRTSLPSPLMRVQQDDLVHVKLESRSNSHTIHHHGIEPTTMNDGVGHVSFEIDGSYIYQWQARHPGTFFYHCHKNTVLHFEMGMYGLLIVDPKPNTNGKVAAYQGGPEYDVEKFWVLDDMDPRWHELDHDAGLCAEDEGLNVFNPKYFLLTGTPTLPDVPTDAHKIVADPGQKILIRLLNASYSVARVTIEGLEANVVSVDGHPLNKPWNRWHRIPAGKVFELSTAQRYDLLIDTNSLANKSRRGTFRVTFEFQHWVTRERHNMGDKVYEGFAFTTITV